MNVIGTPVKGGLIGCPGRKSLHKLYAVRRMKTLGYLYICGFTAEEAYEHPSGPKYPSLDSATSRRVNELLIMGSQ